MKFLLRNSLFLIFIFSLSACAIRTYRLHPRKGEKANNQLNFQAPKDYPHVLQYRVQRMPNADKKAAKKIESELKKLKSFKNKVAVFHSPSKGMFLDIRAKYRDLDKSTKAWLYVDAALLFAIPAWSTKTGHDFFFDVYYNGKLQKTYQYKTHRKLYIWFPLILFSWSNFLTTNQEEIFAQTIRQFFKDAAEDKIFYIK